MKLNMIIVEPGKYKIWKYKIERQRLASYNEQNKFSLLMKMYKTAVKIL